MRNRCPSCFRPASAAHVCSAAEAPAPAGPRTRFRLFERTTPRRPDEQVREWRDLHDGGLTYARIAERFGVTEAVVRHAIYRRWGRQGHKAGRSGGRPVVYGPELVDEWKQLHDLGATYAEVGRQFGVSRDTVQKAVTRRHGPQGDTRRTAVSLLPLALEQRAEGRSWAKIAADLGVTKASLKVAAGRARKLAA